MSKLLKILPWVLLVIFGLHLFRASQLPKDKPGDFQIIRFSKLPIVYQGRVKPIDTLARNSLTIVSRRQSYRDEEGKKQPAIRWLLDVISKSEQAMHHKVFRIENLDVLTSLGLERREGFRYAFTEFKDKLTVLDKESSRARSIEQGQRSIYDIKILEMAGMVHLMTRLMHSFSIPVMENRDDVMSLFKKIQMMEQFQLVHAVPPLGDLPKWLPLVNVLFRDSAAAMLQKEEFKAHKGATHLGNMLIAYKKGNVETFNKELEAYELLLKASPPEKTDQLENETKFNHFEPFYQISVLYIFIAVLSLLSFLFLSAGPSFALALRKSAFWLCVMALCVHTWALIARMSLSGYPPVTNLYSSAIFIGWGCVLIGIIVECIFKIGVGCLMSAITGFITLLIAHFLSGDGDTMEMMQAVLDTKFWLATHVTTITLGYSTTYLAGFFAIFYLISGIFTRMQNKENEKIFQNMIYGILCFALLLSFVGTVLGGLWADDSWGRFWGWDPKENGALIIVLWVALVLHAKWAGMVKTRGLAILAVFGNVVTSWSWFGVNQLGVGLHSYGFLDGAKLWLTIFILCNLVLMALGSIPKKRWRSTSSS